MKKMFLILTLITLLSLSGCCINFYTKIAVDGTVKKGFEIRFFLPE